MITEENIPLIIELFEAIKADWAICDDNDEDEHMVLVDEDRDEHPTLQPPKSLIYKLESEGYIQLDTTMSDPKGKEREYMNFMDKMVPVPFVFFYKITHKGNAFYNANNAS